MHKAIIFVSFIKLVGAEVCTFPRKNDQKSADSDLSCMPLAASEGGEHVEAVTPQNPFGEQSSVQIRYSDAGIRHYASPTVHTRAYPPAVIGTVQQNQTCRPLSFDEALTLAEASIKKSAEHGADIVSLFEEFWPTCDAPANESCFRRQADIIDFCSSRSKQWKMWLLCPMHFHDPHSQRHTNSDFVFNRTGHLVGRYDKMFPVYQPAFGIGTEDRDPSIRGVQVFDSDFGFRFCIIICNDILFPEVSAQCAALGADLIFWAAAWKGGRHVDAMAISHNVNVVNSPGGCGGGSARIVDNVGNVIPDDQLLYHDLNLKVARLDPERTVVHDNFGKLADVLRSHPDIQMEEDPVSEWKVLSAKKNASHPHEPPPVIAVRKILREASIPTIGELAIWNRQGVNMARGGHTPDSHPAFPNPPPTNIIANSKMAALVV